MQAKLIDPDGATLYAWAIPHTHGMIVPVIVHSKDNDFRTRRVSTGVNLGMVTSGSRKPRTDGVDVEIVELDGVSYWRGDHQPGYREITSARELTGTWDEHVEAIRVKRERAEAQEREREAQATALKLQQAQTQVAADLLVEAGIEASVMVGYPNLVIKAESVQDLLVKLGLIEPGAFTDAAAQL